MFLHPWAIVIGVIAAGLPVLVHFLTRPRPRVMPLSTLRFVQDAVRQRRARHRLRDFLILALRTLAVLLLALAVARPLSGSRAPSEEEELGDVVRIVILDVSQSMAADAGRVKAFERARPIAAGHLDYRAGLKVNLIFAGAKPLAVFGQPSTNFGVVREELAKAAPRAERLSVQPALNLAAEMFARSGGSEQTRRELVVVSDFQRTNWANADFAALPADANIRLESVAPDEPAANLAVLGVSATGRVQAGRGVDLTVDVGNFSSLPQDVRVEVVLRDAVYQLSGKCLPHAQTTLRSEIVPRSEGWQTGRATLLGVSDALPADDTRACVLDVRPSPVYAVVTREPASRKPSSSYFIERALAPTESRGTREQVRVVRLDPANLDREAVASAELLVVDHPGKLSDAALNELVSLLRRGRGVIYVAAESIDATNLKRLVERAGSGLSLPVEFVPPSVGQARNNLFLTEYRQDQRPFSVFGDELTAVIAPLRFAGGLNTRRVEGALADDILASFNDRSAFLVAGASDAGALVVLNCDLADSNLPSSSAFVPMLAELIQRMEGGGKSSVAATCGEPLAVYLPAEAGAVDGLEIAPPQPGTPVVGDFSLDGNSVMWSSEAAGPPGVYEVKRGEKTVYAMATAIHPDESDLRTLGADVFQGRLSGTRKVSFRANAAIAGEEQDTLWTYLAVACMVCLLGEVLVLKIFRT